jgi:hypothetical protein
MKEDMYSQNTYYTNLMLKLEKLEEKIESLEREVLILQRFVDTSLKEKYYGKSGPNTPVVVADFSRFLDFDKLKEV